MEKHCDDYIDDLTQPECLRECLEYSRSIDRTGPRPLCFADYEGKRVKIVMASRFGDVGITENLEAENGYSKRVLLADLSNFASQP